MKKFLKYCLSVHLIIFSGILSANDDCPAGYNFAINDFPANQTEYAESEQPNIAYIADNIIGQLEAVERLVVIGHASTYPNTDEQAASEDRAEFVLDSIVAEVEQRIGQEVEFYIEFYGRGDECPVATNDTQAGRASNRRAQVWVELAATPAPTPAPKPEPVAGPSLKKLLNHVVKTSGNPSTVCLAKRLRNKKGNHKYLALSGINAALEPPIDMNNLGSFKKHLFDMRDLAGKFRKKIVTVPTQDTPEKRFSGFMKRSTKRLIRGISSLDSKADCYDKRVVTMRRYLVRKSKKEDSLYSCAIIKKRVETMIDSLGGSPIGCSK